MSFPIATRGASSRSYLYAIVSSISIYSSHIRAVVENCAQGVFPAGGVTETTLRRGIPQARTRQVAIYLAHVAFGLTYNEISLIFRRDRTTVAHACAVVEDLRDDPAIDRALTAIEWALPAFRRGH